MAQRKFTHVNFAQEHPPATINTSNAAFTTAVDNQVGYIHTMKGHYLEFIQTGALDSTVFTKGAQGWTFPELGADGEGIEITEGIQATTTVGSYTIGTDPAFYVSLKFDIPDVSELDVAFVGFRKLAAYADVANAAALGTAYTDIAGLNCDAGDIKTVTRLNTGTAVVTDTGYTDWADGEEHTFKVMVSSAGAVTYTVDGSASGDEVAFTFDTADVVIPTLIFTATGDTASSAPILVEYLCGYQ